jgi:hypothetical protein
MSLHSLVYKINNDLISAFARVDSWFDRVPVFSDDKKSHAVPKAMLRKIIVINEYFLSVLHGSDNDMDKLRAQFDRIKGCDVNAISILVRDEFAGHVADKFIELKWDDTRGVFRDHLFSFLCVLDAFHSDRLNFNRYDKILPGLEILNESVRIISVLVEKCEAELQYS